MIETIRQEQSLKRLTFIYLAALGLIGVLVTGGELWIQVEQNRQAVYDRLLDESERYRRDCNQLVRKMREMVEAPDPVKRDALLKELPRFRDALVSSHQALRSGRAFSSLPTEAADLLTVQLKEVEPHYRSILASIDSIQKAEHASGGEGVSPVSAAAVQQNYVTYAEFAAALGRVIADLVMRNAIRIQTIRLVQVVRLTATLGLLVLVGYIVFRPAVQRTREAFLNLERIGLELAEARDEALESTRLKSAFLANMSHEIRTPLHGVIGMTEILLKTGLTIQQRQFIRTIESSADSLLRIIDGILDLAKIEAGKLMLENQDFDLRNAVEDVIRLLTPKAQAKTLEFITHVDRNVPSEVVGDAARFSQILFNLVDNAIKYTEKGEVFLRISCDSKTDFDADVLVSVCDSGIGLSQKEQQRLFQPFNQGDSSSTRRFGGAGLGLAISRQLAARMNGSIEVQSTPGSGATFQFRVRLRRQSGLSRKPEPPAKELAHARILVVDDNQINHGGLHIQLVLAGIRCDCVSNAAEALERIQERADHDDSFNLIILDMQKPEVDGLALARRIRTQPAWEDIRIFLMTSPETSQERLAREPAIDARITKPINQQQLLSLIGAVGLGKRPAPNSEEPQEQGPLTAPNPAAGAQILLVEDNPTNQEIVGLQLRDFGFKVDVVSNGKEALERQREIHYDLILMDCQMPVMDGYQATRLIRQSEGPVSTPIIALTAHAMNGDRQKCLEAGMDDYIAKPVKQENLKAVIERWLRPEKESPCVTAPAAEVQTIPPAIDKTAFEKICGLANGQGDPDKLVQLIHRFLTYTESEIEAIGQSLEDGNLTHTKELAHSVRGSAGFYGAHRLAGLCGQLERGSMEGDLEESKNLLRLIRDEASRVRGVLEHEVSACGS